MSTEKNQIAAAFELVAETEGGVELTPTQLMKLMYYGQAISLVERGSPLFRGRFEAWTHGPVEPGLWSLTKKSPNWRQELMKFKPQVSDEDWDLVRQIYKVFGGMTPIQLSEATHAERPWIEARGPALPSDSSNNPISETIIRDFYADVIEEGEEVMAHLSIAPAPDRPSWLLPYRIGINLKRLSDHPFFDEDLSRRLRREMSLEEFPDDWSSYDFRPLNVSAEELRAVFRSGG